MAVKTTLLPHDVKVHSLSALRDNYIYLLERAGRLLIIDPGESSPVLAFMEASSSRPEVILLTHDDHDHIGGVPELQNAYGLPVVGAGNMRIRVDHEIQDGERASWLGLDCEIMATPGHRDSDHSFYFPGPGIVFVGDTVFTGGCGRLSLSPETMWNSLQKLRQLPDVTLVFGGHEYSADNYAFGLAQFPDDTAIRAQQSRLSTINTPTSIGEEKKSNVLFRADSLAAFTRLRAAKDRC